MRENYISPEGQKKLYQELEILKTVKRPEVIERISEARDLGDLSENAEYHEARKEQGFIEGRIEEIEGILKTAIVVTSKGKKSVVGLGCKVHATCDNGMKFKYLIVGHSEADPSSGKISHESPVGRALMGKKIGDEFELVVPAGKIKCKVDKIE